MCECLLMRCALTQRAQEMLTRAGARTGAERFHPFNDPAVWREWAESTAWEVRSLFLAFAHPHTFEPASGPPLLPLSLLG